MPTIPHTEWRIPHRHSERKDLCNLWRCRDVPQPREPFRCNTLRLPVYCRVENLAVVKQTGTMWGPYSASSVASRATLAASSFAWIVFEIGCNLRGM